ncbi:hypothetical protein PR003_g8057 [Phytophthora rubi]|uniref:Uncharacterized protein n=2 Tax=Phytophthora rubi TaxID=129364 RepID=A0A6A4FK29_9STRA|nr:hypothetical protein PR003_g8057 [Phytophthora rubi]
MGDRPGAQAQRPAALMRRSSGEFAARTPQPPQRIESLNPTGRAEPPSHSLLRPTPPSVRASESTAPDTAAKPVASSVSSTATPVSAPQPPATAVPAQASSSTSGALKRTTDSIESESSADIIEVDSADTDDAASEPDTTPADSTQHQMSDSNPAEDSDEHDGDVMNPDGCCCTKCMRNWAKTLTERMDQLEENVMGLKREVNQTASGHTASVSSA